MDTSQVSSIIADRCRDRNHTQELDDLLVVVAERQGKNIGDEDLKSGREFVYSYIDLVPYMMAVASTAAENVGLEGAMETILNMVESYWVEGDDIIPDELGVIGLLDDAYCSLTSLQAVSDHYRLQTGKFLFPNDLMCGQPRDEEAHRRALCDRTRSTGHPHHSGSRAHGPDEDICRARKTPGFRQSKNHMEPWAGGLDGSRTGWRDWVCSTDDGGRSASCQSPL